MFYEAGFICPAEKVFVQYMREVVYLLPVTRVYISLHGVYLLKKAALS